MSTEIQTPMKHIPNWWWFHGNSNQHTLPNRSRTKQNNFILFSWIFLIYEEKIRITWQIGGPKAQTIPIITRAVNKTVRLVAVAVIIHVMRIGISGSASATFRPHKSIKFPAISEPSNRDNNIDIYHITVLICWVHKMNTNIMILWRSMRFAKLFLHLFKKLKIKKKTKANESQKPTLK